MKYNADAIKNEHSTQKYVTIMRDGRYECRWVLARPCSDGSFLTRLHEAWLVLIGKADILFWTEQ